MYVTGRRLGEGTRSYHKPTDIHLLGEIYTVVDILYTCILLVPCMKTVWDILCFFYILFTVCLHSHECVSWHTRGGQRTTCQSWFSPSTMWVWGKKLVLLGLAASALTLWATSQHTMWFLNQGTTIQNAWMDLCMVIHSCNSSNEEPDHKFQASPNNLVRLCLRKKQSNNK